MLYYKLFSHPTSKEFVTFIHGAGGSSSIWYKQLRSFKKEFNVLLIDLRGHGQSKKSFIQKIKSYSFQVVGDDIIEVLTHLKIKKSHFVGISLGTIIIREIAERFPNYVDKMILGGAILKLDLRGQFLMRLGDALKSIIPYMLLYRFFAFVIMPKNNHKKSRDLFVNEAKKLEQGEFKKWFALVAEVNPLLRWFRTKEIKLPTMYIMGSEDHMFLPSIKKVVSGHSYSVLSIIPNCGHVVNVEQPDAFNKRAIEFLINKA